jgi:hypothetical protein
MGETMTNVHQRVPQAESTIVGIGRGCVRCHDRR